MSWRYLGNLARYLVRNPKGRVWPFTRDYIAEHPIVEGGSFLYRNTPRIASAAVDNLRAYRGQLYNVKDLPSVIASSIRTGRTRSGNKFRPSEPYHPAPPPSRRVRRSRGVSRGGSFPTVIRNHPRSLRFKGFPRQYAASYGSY